MQFAERRHESLLPDDARADGTSAVAPLPRQSDLADPVDPHCVPVNTLCVTPDSVLRKILDGLEANRLSQTNRLGELAAAPQVWRRGANNDVIYQLEQKDSGFENPAGEP